MLICLTGLATAVHAKWSYTDDHIWTLSDNAQDYSWSWQEDKSCADIKQDYAKRPYRSRSDNTHRGIDFHHARGTPILAAAPGEVIATIDDYWGAGKTVIIYHGQLPEGGHLFTYYMHMEDIRVDEQTPVRRGQQIGTMGNTGALAGRFVHLHFATRTNSNGNFTYGKDMEYSDSANFTHKNPHQYWYGANRQSKEVIIPIYVENRDYGDRGSHSTALTLPIPCH